ncbi:MAG: TVP38/TMEM64 family protein [Deltaproteobacteria bacterium]|nr:TVP38/TMEM64 family protein [Deltaproteobacteria bacterium]
MNYRRVTVLILFFALIVLLYFFTPLRTLFSHEGIENLRLWIRSQGSLAPLIYLSLYVLATVAFMPGTVVTLLGGVLFGIWWGTLLVIVGSNLGALVAFLIARALGRNSMESLLSGRIAKLDKGIGKRGFYIVFWLRLIPVFPYNALNYALGLTKVSTRDYVAANLIGMIPASFALVSLGNAAAEFSLRDPKVWLRIEVWGPLLLVLFLAFLPKLFKKQLTHLRKLAKK